MKAVYVLLLIFILLSDTLCIILENKSFHSIDKRALQKTHEKSQLEKWEDKFLGDGDAFDQTESLVNLLSKVADNYLMGCTPVILYDRFTESGDELLLEKLFRAFPASYVHGQITEGYRMKVPNLIRQPKTCISYILFLEDVMRCKSVIGPQATNRVIIVARSSQWRVYEFLANEVSQSFMNLLVIAKTEKTVSSKTELPYILYTHKFYVDALGSSTHQVLTSWKDGELTRPHISLFPNKMIEGFSGHRFIISVANQPPFVIKKSRDDNDDIEWDGIEIRLMALLSKMYNFTTDYREAKDADILGSSEAVTKTIVTGKANIGIAGLYVTVNRYETTDTSYMHSQDCAAFISLTSTALPRYRAIMGPFHWSVWLSLTTIYLFAIFPLSFADKHTLRPLLKNPEEMENMFWYVFGTFTNCFTFVGQRSWSRSDKVTTRLLIGFYWLFTIIITSCYTGSIIAFVTLPVYPSTVDTTQQLLNGRFQIGTLDKGGWEYWFNNVTDPNAIKLLRKIELVPDVESGLRNTTKAFFWNYAFLGSRAHLDYIVRTNFTTMKKRSLMHITNECFVPFGVSIIYNRNSLFSRIIDNGILRIVQSGLMKKLKSDVEWEVMRSSTGKLLAANSFGKSIAKLTVEDRALNLDDTQGMFLLLGIGFALGGSSLLSEWLGGCFNFCKRMRPKTTATIQSNYRSHDNLTPREKLDSLQNNSLNVCRNNRNTVNNHRRSSFENSIFGDRISNCHFIVHANIDCDEDGNKTELVTIESKASSDGSKSAESTDFEEEINRLFKFEEMSGEDGTSNQNDEEILVDKTKNSKST